MGSQGTAVSTKKKDKNLSTSSSAIRSPKPDSIVPGTRTGKPNENGTNQPRGDIVKAPIKKKDKDPGFVYKGPVDFKKEDSGDKLIKDARETIDKIETERKAQEDAAKKKLAEEAAAAQAAAEKEQTDLAERQTPRGRQKAKSIAEYGRSDTILTSPLGLPGGSGSRAKKTLLGV